MYRHLVFTYIAGSRLKAKLTSDKILSPRASIPVYLVSRDSE